MPTASARCWANCSATRSSSPSMAGWYCACARYSAKVNERAGLAGHRYRRGHRRGGTGAVVRTVPPGPRRGQCTGHRAGPVHQRPPGAPDERRAAGGERARPGQQLQRALPLPVLAAAEDGPTLLPEPPILVRGRDRELVDSACGWLRRWGANAQPLQGDPALLDHDGAILMDGEAGMPLAWAGPRVVASIDGGDQPTVAADGSLVVTLHGMTAIRQCTGQRAEATCGAAGNIARGNADAAGPARAGRRRQPDQPGDPGRAACAPSAATWSWHRTAWKPCSDAESSLRPGGDRHQHAAPWTATRWPGSCARTATRCR